MHRFKRNANAKLEIGERSITQDTIKAVIKGFNKEKASEVEREAKVKTECRLANVRDPLSHAFCPFVPIPGESS